MNFRSVEVQTLDSFPSVPIRHGKRHSEKIKNLIASVSSKIAITAPQALQCFQEFANGYFDQTYSLSITEGGLFPNVLPSAQTIRRTKHNLAVLSEQHCAVALLNKSYTEKAVIYYDSTTRKGVKGEWTTVSVMIGDVLYRLRPLSLARESREHIKELFLETLKRLSLLVECKMTDIWEKIDALMTDSVNKNMEVEKLVALEIGSSHVPIHLICQSHFCESADRAVSKCLVEIEETVSLKERILENSPELSSFISNSSITIASLHAISSMVNDTGKTSNLHAQWIKLLKDFNKRNEFVSFKENRFAQIGFFAAATIHHWQDLKVLLGKH